MPGDVTLTPSSSSATSRLADRLRERIIGGELLPGQKVSQEHVQTSLGVSRSTLREAVQVLVRERLLVHRLGAGVFVRQLTASDISDLYHARRIVECAAIQRIQSTTPERMERVHAAIADGRAGVAAEDWALVAAASIRFHEAVVALAGSERLDGMVVGLLAEFRLAYAFMRDPQAFHVAFLERHQEIAEAIAFGDLFRGAALLESYLVDAERAVLASYRP